MKRLIIKVLGSRIQKKIANFILFLITSNCIYGQTVIPYEYSEYIKKAESYFQKKEYSLAAECYQIAFNYSGGVGRAIHVFKSAESYSMASNLDSAFSKLEKVFKAGIITKDTVVNSVFFNNLKSDERWQLLVSKYGNQKEVINHGNNIEFGKFIKKLEQIYYSDQAINNNINFALSSKNTFALDSLALAANDESIRNINVVSDFISKFGWLPESKIGHKANLALFLTIQHSSLSIQKKYLPIIKKAMKNNLADPRQYAYLYDRVLVSKGRKQYYGTQYIFKEDKKVLAPIRNSRNLEYRKKNLNLD